MSTRVAINEEAFLNIVDQMRITVPQEIRQAREIALERDKYIAQAHEEAREIIAQAREDAARQLDEHSLRKEAEERASAVLKEALEEATRIRSGAEDYAEAKLRELAEQLDHLQGVVRNGIVTIESRQVKARPQPESAKPPVSPAPVPVSGAKTTIERTGGDDTAPPPEGDQR